MKLLFVCIVMIFSGRNLPHHHRVKGDHNQTVSVRAGDLVSIEYEKQYQLLTKAKVVHSSTLEHKRRAVVKIEEPCYIQLIDHQRFELSRIDIKVQVIK